MANSQTDTCTVVYVRFDSEVLATLTDALEYIRPHIAMSTGALLLYSALGTLRDRVEKELRE